MLDAMEFLQHCPEGHECHPTFERTEFEKALADNTLNYFCVVCGQQYQFSEVEKTNMQRFFNEKAGFRSAI
jgi:hypothetical protein